MAVWIGAGDPFDLEVGCPDLLVQALPLRPEVGDQVAHTRGKVRVGVLEDLWHGQLQLRRALGEGHAAFE